MPSSTRLLVLLVVCSLAAPALARTRPARAAASAKGAARSAARARPAAVAPTPVAPPTRRLPSVDPLEPVPAASPLAAEPELVVARCLLDGAQSDGAADAACLTCHPTSARGSHRSGFGYTHANPRLPPGSLRSLDEVVARGLLLPDGEVRCVTCHDARSPWRYHIALPPGSTASPSARPGRTGNAVATAAARPQPGAEVTPTPLCRACHTLGD